MIWLYEHRYLVESLLRKVVVILTNKQEVNLQSDVQQGRTDEKVRCPQTCVHIVYVTNTYVRIILVRNPQHLV